MKLSPLHCIKFPSRQSSDSAAFLIGTEKKDEAWRVVSTSFELHFYSITNEERSTRAVFTKIEPATFISKTLLRLTRTLCLKMQFEQTTRHPSSVSKTGQPVEKVYESF